MFSKYNRKGQNTKLFLFLFPFALMFVFSFIFYENNSKEEHHNQIKTPEEALLELKNGNRRFLENHLTHTNYVQQILETKEEQHPHTLILSCIDSRIPPEIIFDQGIGNLFVARVAGNIEDDNILGSMEFAAKIKHAKLIVVLGHSHCGAIKGAIENANLEHLTQLFNQIKPAIGPHKTNEIMEGFMDDTSKHNVLMTIDDILHKSVTLRKQIQNHELKIVGAYYDVSNGKVIFL
jgi:carbonic anhydrase